MNISEAKEELIRVVKAYLQKDEDGRYLIPAERQRPVLLMGGPGIGKTAVMRQIAEELGISLVSYTITHHTRQSAIGLPAIEERVFPAAGIGGAEAAGADRAAAAGAEGAAAGIGGQAAPGERYKVTEYTMSEIVASVYDQIARSGIREGILFLDEINCVSETLAPTMLQFLQYKTFGNHRVPEGYVIVTAGNPPEYNRSVRDFDIVTLDRVRLMEVKEDFAAWKAYALKAGVHGAVMSYLEIKKEHFYSVKADLKGKRFATPRGWEDLSDSLKVYERLAFPVTENFVYSFLQDREIAESFATYYDLYVKYRELYRVGDILDGKCVNAAGAGAGADASAGAAADVGAGTISAKLRSAPFDEKLSLIGLLSDALGQEFRTFADRLAAQQEVFESLKELKEAMAATGTGEPETMAATGTDFSVRGWLEACVQEKKRSLEHDLAARLIGPAAEKRRRMAISGLEAACAVAREAGISGARTGSGPRETGAVTSGAVAEAASSAEVVFAAMRGWFGKAEEERLQAADRTGQHLTNAFDFLAETFGEGQEMVLFLSELSAGYYSLQFVRENGNEAYYKYNRLLLMNDRRETLKAEAMRLL